MTVSLHKSLGFFFVFWLLSTMLLLGWSPFVLLFLRPSICTTTSNFFLVTVPRAPITIGITVTFFIPLLFEFSRDVLLFLSLFSPSLSFTLWLTGTAKFTIQQVLFFCCWLSLGLVVWPRLDDPFVFQNPSEFCSSHFLGRILGRAYNNFLYCQI